MLLKAMLLQKHYFFTIRWGIGTDTIDITGKHITQSNIKPEKCNIQNILQLKNL